MSLAERLRDARKALQLSATDMATQIGVSRRTWESYERGESDPKVSVLEWLIGSGFAPDWLLTGKGPQRRANVDVNDNVALDAVHDDWITFPLYTARAAAGAGAVNEEGFPSPGLAFDPALAAHLLNTSPRSLAGLYVAGDSMEPTFGDGDVLIINTSVERITGDAIYVLLVDEGCIVKRITCLTDGRLVLRSDNSTYADETIDPARKGQLKIYGRVVAAVKRL